MGKYDYLKRKVGKWMLKPYEERLKSILLPRIPLWLETYHLTYMTLLWSILTLLFFYLGSTDYIYLYLIPFLILLQYLTDLLDGAVGRTRNTGLITWGYYADHFFDYIFVMSILLGYGLNIGFDIWLFILAILINGLFIQAFLNVNSEKNFVHTVGGVGPTEIRLLIIIGHTIVVAFGLEYLSMLLPYIVAFLICILILSFWKISSNLWKYDMEIKNKQ